MSKNWLSLIIFPQIQKNTSLSIAFLFLHPHMWLLLFMRAHFHIRTNRRNLKFSLDR
jgi:hypothetical protein